MDTSTHNGSADQSLGDLTKHLSDAVSRLFRKEAELAKTEISEKARTMAVGAGLAAGAGVLALTALGALTAAAMEPRPAAGGSPESGSCPTACQPVRQSSGMAQEVRAGHWILGGSN